MLSAVHQDTHTYIPLVVLWNVVASSFGKMQHGFKCYVTYLLLGLDHHDASTRSLSRPEGELEEVQRVASESVADSGIKLRLRNRTWNYEVGYERI